MIDDVLVGVEQYAADAIWPAGAAIENAVYGPSDMVRQPISDIFRDHLRRHVLDVLPAVLGDRLREVVCELVQESYGYL